MFQGATKKYEEKPYAAFIFTLFNGKPGISFIWPYIILYLALYSDEGITSETSVSILSFLWCRIYIFITKLFI